MGAIYVKSLLAEEGFTSEQFLVLHRALSSHEGRKGGQHTNAGCRLGRCDYGDERCSAWTALLEAIRTIHRRAEPGAKEGSR